MNNSLVKEAENIINEYIRENHYNVLPDKRGKLRIGKPRRKLPFNAVMDILLLAGIAALILAVTRLL